MFCFLIVRAATIKIIDNVNCMININLLRYSFFENTSFPVLRLKLFLRKEELKNKAGYVPAEIRITSKKRLIRIINEMPVLPCTLKPSIRHNKPTVGVFSNNEIKTTKNATIILSIRN